MVLGFMRYFDEGQILYPIEHWQLFSYFYSTPSKVIYIDLALIMIFGGAKVLVYNPFYPLKLSIKCQNDASLKNEKVE